MPKNNKISFNIVSILLTSAALASSKNVTFKKVNICFYTQNIKNSIQETQNKHCQTIINSTSLDNVLSTKVHTISIQNENVPVIYTNTFVNVNSVKQLILQNCELKIIEPNAFLETSKFHKFNFEWNKIEEVKTGVFDNLNLRYLNLNHNQIRFISPKAFDNLKYLIEIHLSDNRLTNFDNQWFPSSPMLQELHFENNSIESIPANAFKNFKNHFSFNIYFSFNKIKFVDEKAFRDLEHTIIHKFFVDFNNLELWQENFSSNIIELKINNNQLKCIYGNLHNILRNNTVKNFEFNPYNCSCLKEIKTWWDVKNEESQWFKGTYLKCREEARKKAGRERSGTLLHNLRVFNSL